MKIAVLMSTYNGARYLREQLDSILRQEDIPGMDLWVRDDGSTDETLEILREYEQAGKLRWYTGENLKPAKSFLDLIRHTPGYDYYAFADQDDYWYTDKLHSGIAMLADREGPAMSFANARLVDGQRRSLGRDVYRKAEMACDFYSVVYRAGILGCTVMFNGALAELVRTRPMPEELTMHDVYLAVVCALHGGAIVYDSRVHMDYRQHGNNVVGTQWTKTAALRERLHRITHPQPISISAMAKSICRLYPDAPDKQKLHWLQAVADYKRSAWAALKLAADTKPVFTSRNQEITMRLAVLLRNR